VASQIDVRRLDSGDVEAIARLMEQCQHRLYRYLLRLVLQPSVAEDLFQQTWLRIMERIHHYDPQRGFEGWLFAVAHNLAIDHLRRRQPKSLDEPAFSEATRFSLARSADPGALDQLLSQEKADWIMEAVENLPVVLREVIALRFEEEMKLEEIAEALTLPAGTVKTRLRRALIALRQSLRKKPN